MATRKTFGMRKSSDSLFEPPPDAPPKSFAKPASPFPSPPPDSPPPHHGRGDDGVVRVFPKEVRPGETDFLPAQQSVEAVADTSEADQKRFLETLNATLPEGVSVVPWAMMPWTLWKTDCARFLMITCELYPAAPWNQFLLPADALSATALGLPEHPREYPPGMETAARGNLDRIEEEFSAAHKPVEQRSLANDTDAAAGYADLRKAIQWKVMAMANTYASITFGEEAYEHHLKLFGKSLDSPVLNALLAKRQLN